METTLYCPQALYDRWRVPPEDPNHGQLARLWHELYPGLFDEQDLHMAAESQWHYHFYEWFAAIHLFQRDGSISMVEKYYLPSHHQKLERMNSLLSDEQKEVIRYLDKEGHVQPPDLFVIAPEGKSFSFAEVKGKGDKLREPQVAGNEIIRQRMNAPIEIINVKLVRPPRG